MSADLLSELRTIISFPSVADNAAAKQECLDWILQSFLGQALRTAKRGAIDGAPYLYVPHSDPALLWFAHIDVIPALETQFSLAIDGDRAIGRGVKDMKGAALAFLIAYRDAIAQGQTPRVSILLTSDEETAGQTIPRLLQEGIIDAPAAFTPDAGSLGRIVTEHKGVVWADLIAEGKGAHGAYPWDGENPVYLLAEALQAIADRFPPGTRDDWRVTVSATELRGSDARNKIPDRAVCGIDIRFPPEECASAQEAVARVTSVLPEGCRIEIRTSADPLLTPADHPMVRLLQTVTEEVTGSPTPTGREHGGSDARYFGAHGIPAFLNGPIGGGIHGADEWVSIASLNEHLEINRRLLAALAGPL